MAILSKCSCLADCDFASEGNCEGNVKPMMPKTPGDGSSGAGDWWHACYVHRNLVPDPPLRYVDEDWKLIGPGRAA